ncbi:MAG: hypothetical protein GY698_04410 [Actinomycetia bacterium]|nr:hypothetical protein [Actinomycetes bacterium]
MAEHKDLGFEPISRDAASSQIRRPLLRPFTTGELAPGRPMTRATSPGSGRSGQRPVPQARGGVATLLPGADLLR